jgi:hypothetical protein
MANLACFYNFLHFLHFLHIYCRSVCMQSLINKKNVIILVDNSHRSAAKIGLLVSIRSFPKVAYPENSSHNHRSRN